MGPNYVIRNEEQRCFEPDAFRPYAQFPQSNNYSFEQPQALTDTGLLLNEDGTYILNEDGTRISLE